MVEGNDESEERSGKFSNTRDGETGATAHQTEYENRDVGVQSGLSDSEYGLSEDAGIPDVGSPEFLEWGAEQNGWKTGVDEEELERGDDVLYWSAGNSQWYEGEVDRFEEDPLFDETHPVVKTDDGDISTSSPDMRLVGTGGEGTPPNPQDVQERREAERVESAKGAVSGVAGEWIEREFPLDRFDDMDQAVEFIETIGEGAETFDLSNEDVEEMFEKTDLHIQRGIAGHFGGAAMASMGESPEVALDPDEGVNTAGTVAHEIGHTLMYSNGMDVPHEGSNHAGEWSEKGLTFDAETEEYLLQRAEGIDDVPSEDFVELAEQANGVIKETAEAVRSGEFESWSNERVINNFEYAHTNASEAVSEGVRAMRSERTREQLEEHWPEFHDALSTFIADDYTGEGS